MYTLKLEKEYFHFCAAHFAIFSKSDREPLHGHNYYVEVELSGALLTDGKLIDISKIKPVIRDLCDTLDHQMLLPQTNPHISITEENHNYIVTHADSTFSFPKKETFILPIGNTTMENLAEYIAQQLIKTLDQMDHSIEEFSVTVQETQGQKGQYCHTIK